MKTNSHHRRPPFFHSSFFILPLLLLACVATRAENWTSLFNGTNLNGWAVMNGGKFSVTNGTIQIEGGMGWLRTERVFTNFILQAEWRGLETNYNSGFFLRCVQEGKPMPTNGWQVNLKQADLGAWLKNKDIKLSPKPPIVPVGEWATFTMEVQGTNASLSLNGKHLWTQPFDATSGFIGIQAEDKHMELRNVRVRELASLPVSSISPVSKKYAGATPLEWSQRLADSEIERRSNSLSWRSDGKAKWDYTAGLFTLALLKLEQGATLEKYPAWSGNIIVSPKRVQFANQAIGSFISPDGNIETYKPEEFQLDALNPGKTVLALWQLTGEERYKLAAQKLAAQFKTQPRTFDGGFWHKQRYTNQMWLDGIYMADPFHAECGKLFGDAAAFDDVAKQIRLIDEHTYDAKTGLNYHGWDALKTQPWANPVTGCSSNFWGRAEGWYAMALVDVLDFIPTNHPARPEIIATLQKTANGIVKWQDEKTGLWWQVMDQGDRKGNYLEATASAMFVYALAKGVNHGYLSRDLVPAIERGYAGIIRDFIKPDGENRWSLTHCCSVAGLGGSPSNGHYRSGSFDYYISEPIVSNDLKGVGPFILAGIEMQQLNPASPK